MLYPFSISLHRGRHRWRTTVGMTMLTALLAGTLSADEAAPDTTEPAAKPKVTKPIAPTNNDVLVAKLVASVMASNHYNKQPLNNDVSSLFFDEFIESLDHGRMYFLKSDIDEFGAFRYLLDDLVPKGKLQFPYRVFDRFKQRVAERVKFASERLQQPFSFDVVQDYTPDRSEAPWCETEDELNAVWALRLKNDVLNRELLDARRAKAEADIKAANAEKKEADPETAEKDDKQTDENAEEKTAKVEEEPKTPAERTLDQLEKYLHRIEQYESIEILEIFCAALARSYDPHSSYMAPSTKENFDISMKLSLEGIGARLSTRDSYVYVVNLIPGGPAEQDNRLKAGDLIIAVAQEGESPVNVVDMPLRKVVKMIRGPKGKKVYLTVLEGDKGVGSTPVVIDIVRDKVLLKKKEAKRTDYRITLRPDDLHTTMTKEESPEEDKPEAETAEADTSEKDKDGEKQASAPKEQPRPNWKETLADDERGITVIRLPSFYMDFAARRAKKKDYKSSTRDIRRFTEQALEDGASGIILDLRSNGGGSLEEAVTLAGLFFTKGPVVQVQNTQRRREIRWDRDKSMLYDGPLVVLVNQQSASAAEIVAACLQDIGRAVVVGESSTHGKGTVQTVYGLEKLIRNKALLNGESPGSLKFTIAKFYRVNGGSTQRKGVTPDIVFPSVRDHMEIGEASLEGALPWDKIDAVPLSTPRVVDPILPELLTRSKQRLDTDKRFQALTEYVAEYGERRSKKTVSLHRETREREQEEQQEWRKAAREKMYGPEEEDAKDTDLILEEAMNVMADMLRMQVAQVESNTAANLQEPAAETPETDVAAPAQ